MWRALSSLRSSAARFGAPTAIPGATTSAALPSTASSSPLGNVFTSWARPFARKVGGKVVVMKRAFKGLYHGAHIQFGNKTTFSHKKTRRTWKPNVQNKRFWSELYQRYLHFRATARVIKMTKRLGGIDNYLKETPNEKLLYQRAIKIKRNQARMRRWQERDAAIAAIEEAELEASRAAEASSG